MDAGLCLCVQAIERTAMKRTEIIYAAIVLACVVVVVLDLFYWRP